MLGSIPSKYVRFAVAAMLAVGTLSGCDQIKDATQQMHQSQAFLDSQIPPGLSPQYFPPQGFVWGAYRAKSLPEARYGVASPPINPSAQVLILADADYPAESYFEVMRQLLDAGYGVWLFEAPGQGGSGRYLLQNDAVFISGAKDPQVAALGFINDIIKPTSDKPLFIVGTGVSAIHVLSLSTNIKSDAIGGYVGYDPYLGGEIAKGMTWHREAKPGSYWGQIAQTWQMSNPDLRLSVKSEAWQKQTRKAYTELNGLHLPVVSLKPSDTSVLVLAPDAEAVKDTGPLCARLPRCRVAQIEGPQVLGRDIAAFIEDERPRVDISQR